MASENSNNCYWDYWR